MVPSIAQATSANLRMTCKTMKIGFVQFNPAFGQVTKNLSTIHRLVSSVKADLLVLPELCLSGYNFVSMDEVRQLSETSDGPSIKSLKLLSKKTGTILVAGFAEKSGSKTYNSAILIRPSGKTDIYRKTHLFWNEKKWFAPGDTGFKVYRAGQTKIGMMICYDWFFPEAARSLALAGRSDNLPPGQPGAALLSPLHAGAGAGEQGLHHHRQPDGPGKAEPARPALHRAEHNGRPGPKHPGHGSR